MSNQTDHTDVLARTVPFTFERHNFGLHRKANLAAMESKAAIDPSMVSLNKKLLNMRELVAITSHDAQFRAQLDALSTPFAPGLCLVPFGLVERVDGEATAWEIERNRLADLAAEAYWPRTLRDGEYPDHLRAIQAKLGPLFDPRNYPSRERFRAAYWCRWRWVNLGAPNVLREFKADIFRREAEKTRRLGDQARTMVEQHLLSTLKGITEHLHTLLLPTGDGKTRRLFDGALDNLTDFLSTVEARNITNNADLAGITRHLRDLQARIDVDQLRDNKALRTEAAITFGSITETLATLVEDEPDREIRVTPDTVAV